MNLHGRVAIVTGASSGIGYATARELSRRGATIVGVARREERLRALIDECGGEASYLAGDLSERGFAESIVARTVERHGGLDILINNAAMPFHKDIYAVTVEEIEAAFRINFESCVWTTFAAIPCFLNRGGGTIVNVSSFASKVVPSYETIYAATKGAMNGFSEGLWNDLAGSNIHVCLVHPGPIDTEIWGKQQQPSGYSGKKHPPESVARGIIEAIEKKRFEVVLPRRDLQLGVARWMRFLFPSLVRKGVASMDPVDPAHLDRARRRATQQEGQ